MIEQSPTAPQPRASGGAEISVRIGTAVAFDARVTTAGLLAVGALMSGILLGSAAIVLAAKRDRGRSVPKRLAQGS